MADSPPTVPITITYKQAGSKSSLFVAGSFTTPHWEAVELYREEIDGVTNFCRTFDLAAGKYHLKFRNEVGDWWAINEDMETEHNDQGIINNVLFVSEDAVRQCTLPQTQETRVQLSSSTSVPTATTATPAQVLGPHEGERYAPAGAKPARSAISGDSRHAAVEGASSVDVPVLPKDARSTSITIHHGNMAPENVPVTGITQNGEELALLHSSFPNGVRVNNTAGNGQLCGLYALSGSLEGIVDPVPTWDKLFSLRQTMDFNNVVISLPGYDPATDRSTRNYSITQLEALLIVYASTVSLDLTLGTLTPTSYKSGRANDHRVWLQRLPTDQADARIVWIYNDGANSGDKRRGLNRYSSMGQPDLGDSPTARSTLPPLSALRIHTCVNGTATPPNEELFALQESNYAITHGAGFESIQNARAYSRCNLTPSHEQVLIPRSIVEHVHSPILRANLAKLGIKVLYDIQTAFPASLSTGLDVIITTFPGSGKTADYLIGGLDTIMCSTEKCEQAVTLFKGDLHMSISYNIIHQRCKEGKFITPKMIIFLPTRQLAKEVYDQMAMMCDQSTTVPGIMYGSGKEGRTIRLGERCDILVACPGIFLKSMNLGVIDMSYCRHIVIDEYAEMVASLNLSRQLREALLPTGDGFHLHRDGKQIQVTVIGTIVSRIWRESADEWIRSGSHERKELSWFSHERDFKDYTLFTIQGDFYTECARCILENCPLKTLIFTVTKFAGFTLQKIIESISNRPVFVTNSDLTQSERDAASKLLRTKENMLVISCGDLAQGVNIPNLKTVVLCEIPSDNLNKFAGETSRTDGLGNDGHVLLMEGPDPAAQQRLLMVDNYLAGAKVECRRRTWDPRTGTSPSSAKLPSSKQVSQPNSSATLIPNSNVAPASVSKAGFSTMNVNSSSRARASHKNVPPPAALRTSKTSTYPAGSSRQMQKPI